MNRVLHKRLLRDLKSSFARYLALMLLTIMAMYIVISLIGAAEVIIAGTDKNAKSANTEDGYFSVFVPLSDSQLEQLEKNGTQIEKMFSLDIKLDDESTLRLMENRKNINLIVLDDGRLAENNGEAVLEKRYAASHELKTGDFITIAGTSFKIVGTGSTPDYDMPIAKLSDTAVESSSFGLAFVTPEQYEKIKTETSQKAEDCTYSYVLGDNVTHEQLKEEIRNLDFDYTEVEDKYFREMIDEFLNEKNELEEGVNKLLNGAESLSDGLSELDDNSSALADGASVLFDTYLAQAQEGLAVMGITDTLTSENYDDILDDYISATGSGELIALRASLDGIHELTDGIKAYTDGVSKASDGSYEMTDGVRKLKDKTDELIDELFNLDIDNLTAFVKAEDNGRIAAAANDVIMNKRAGLISGIIALILFTYVMSVFVIHQIQRESSVIGALYALGVKKKDLLFHYITMPTIVAFLGGVIGTLAGISNFGIDTQTADSYNYFSLPVFEKNIPMYLLAYGIITPAVISVIVNTAVINKRLSQPALTLIKNEQKTTGLRSVQIKSHSFIRVFQTRQMLREARSSITVILGMFLALLILMLALNSYILCKNISVDNSADTRYEYMYTLKYPESVPPEQGETAYIESLSKANMGFNLEITVMGIQNDSKYFDAAPEKGKNKIIVSNSFSEKYNVKPSDKIILTDSASETDYCFTVAAVTKYSVGLTVFMDIDSMRELFGQDEDYYNAIFSDQELDIDEGRLYSVTTRADIEKSSSVFIELMIPMIVMLLSVSVIIFCVVMYLMIGVMIDRASFGISLIKIFGFRTNEIRRLYIDANTVVVAVGALVAIPLAKAVVDSIYPMLVANIVSGINTAFPPYLYIGIFAGIMIAYFIINRMLTGKIKRISPAEVLKNRE